MSATAAAIRAAALATLMLVSGGSAVAQEVSAQGSTEITFNLMLPRKADIERLSGQSLRIVSSSSSRGLAALVVGSADIALLAEPLFDMIGDALKVAPGSIDASKLEEFHIANGEIHIIANAANPVARLDDRQVAAIFSGAVSDWRAFGGPAVPILVVTDPTCSPHGLLQKSFGFAMSPRARAVQNAMQTAQIVAQIPGAISYFSAEVPLADRDRVKIIATDTRVLMGFRLAIRKDASSGVRRVVDAARQLGGPY
ncbi:MAG: substrate-binding domain-containing protein [Proteobacteria bacterium]|nr:substrate-binding domain-containing protein [Pseudomonadota bacterium]